jgi:hypothetical protein
MQGLREMQVLVVVGGRADLVEEVVLVVGVVLAETAEGAGPQDKVALIHLPSILDRLLFHLVDMEEVGQGPQMMDNQEIIPYIN